MSPSKTPRKINASKLYLHSVREGLRFIHFETARGQLKKRRVASQLRWTFNKNRVKMRSLLVSPSKTPRNINIPELYLHSVREGLRLK